VLTGAAYQAWLSVIHVVIPNEVYRSSQLSPNVLKYYIKTKGIKSVINLRGAEPYATWYLDELNTSQQMGAQHYDLDLASKELPSKQRMRKLVYILLNAPKPILVHCLGGADRSGLASAVSLILDKNASLQQAEQQVSIRHFVLSSISIGKLVLPYYQHWLTQQNVTASKQSFLTWVCSPNPFNTQGNPPYPVQLDYYNPCPSLNLPAATQH
jgi:protein-tyrosine phosphatase